MRKKALLIGINNYPHPYELTGCLEDIASLKSAIERDGDGRPNFEVKTMPDVKSSRLAMREIETLVGDDADVALV